MAKDLFGAKSGPSIGPASRLRAVVPSNDEDLEYVTNGIIASGAGTISIIARDDTAAVTVPIAAGQLLPIRAKRIRATGTTATGIVALIS